MSSDNPGLLHLNNAIWFVKDSSLTSKEPVNYRPIRMRRLIHRELKHNKAGQLIMTPRTTQQPTHYQTSLKRLTTWNRIRNGEEIKNWSHTQTGQNKTLLPRRIVEWNTIRGKSRRGPKAADKENFWEEEEDELTYINLWFYIIKNGW